jgi:hypothetical protein
VIENVKNTDHAILNLQLSRSHNEGDILQNGMLDFKIDHQVLLGRFQVIKIRIFLQQNNKQL